MLMVIEDFWWVHGGLLYSAFVYVWTFSKLKKKKGKRNLGPHDRNDISRIPNKQFHLMEGFVHRKLSSNRKGSV